MKRNLIGIIKGLMDLDSKVREDVDITKTAGLFARAQSGLKEFFVGNKEPLLAHFVQVPGFSPKSISDYGKDYIGIQLRKLETQLAPTLQRVAAYSMQYGLPPEKGLEMYIRDKLPGYRALVRAIKKANKLAKLRIGYDLAMLQGFRPEHISEKTALTLYQRAQIAGPESIVSNLPKVPSTKEIVEEVAKRQKAKKIRNVAIGAGVGMGAIALSKDKIKKYLYNKLKNDFETKDKEE